MPSHSVHCTHTHTLSLCALRTHTHALSLCALHTHTRPHTLCIAYTHTRPLTLCTVHTHTPSHPVQCAHTHTRPLTLCTAPSPAARPLFGPAPPFTSAPPLHFTPPSRSTGSVSPIPFGAAVEAVTRPLRARACLAPAALLLAPTAPPCRLGLVEALALPLFAFLAWLPFLAAGGRCLLSRAEGGRADHTTASHAGQACVRVRALLLRTRAATLHTYAHRD